MRKITLKRTIFTFALISLLVSFVQAADITSVQSGAWTDASTWNSGKLPTIEDDVTIAEGHIVTYLIDAAVTTVELCKDLIIEGTLQASNLKKANFFTNIYGKVVCNGSLELGQVGNNVTGIVFTLKGEYTSITGTGTINIKNINLTLTEPEPENAHCFINVPTINISHSMSISQKAKMIIDANSTINMPSTSTISLASNGGQGAKIGELDIYGTLNAGTVILRNDIKDSEEKSKLNIKNGGVLNVSQAFTPIGTAGTAENLMGGTGVILTVESGGSLNWTSPAEDPRNWTNPENAPNYDPNLEIIFSEGSFINGEKTPEASGNQIIKEENPIQFNAIEKIISFNSEVQKIEIYNLLGEKIYQKISPDQNIQLSNLSTGVYIIQAVDTNSEVYNKKISIN